MSVTRAPVRAPSVAAPGARPWGRRGLRAAAGAYLLVMVALPLAAILESGLSGGPARFWSDVTQPVALGALWLTVWTAGLATLINAVMGTMTAYALVRYEFPGRELLNGMVDLPFAIPTLVTGVMLVALYGPQGVLGALFEARGVQIIFAAPGIVLALLLVTYPFVVRAVQPVLLELQCDQEEAAYTLGGSPAATFFRVVLPNLLPAIRTGALLAFARALGEFGSVVVVAGNIAGRTLTAPVHVYQQIESQNARAASAVSLVLLALSLGLMLAVEGLRRRGGRAGEGFA